MEKTDATKLTFFRLPNELDELKAFVEPFDLPISIDTIVAQAANGHILLTQQGRLLGQCSLWWEPVPAHSDHQLGLIGHYHAVDSPSSRQVLEFASKQLALVGASQVLGPMDGNTWCRYRWVTESNGEPPFLFEPYNPAQWPLWWQEAGFSPAASYHSSRIALPQAESPKLARAIERLSARGICLKPIKPEAFEAALNAIYRISCAAFADNLFYSPLEQAQFSAMYQPAKAMLDGRFCQIAYLAEQPVGFVFALPDFAQQQRGEPIDTLILKTLAVLPGKQYGGLGAWLLHQCQKAADQAGFKWAIHALMHDGNRSANMGPASEVIRRYQLFSKELM